MYMNTHMRGAVIHSKFNVIQKMCE